MQGYKKLERLEKDLERDIYKKSYYEFYKKAFAQLHPGDDYDENWHAKYLCDRLQEEAYRLARKEPRTKDLIINMPFRASKSLITTIIFPIWCWAAVDPSMKFITVSYSGDLALEHARRSKDLMESAWFQHLYGNVVKLKGDARATSHYETVQTGMRKAVGTGGQITGSGGDIIIIDDPQNPKKAASETERENTKTFYDHTLYSRLNQPDVGVRIIVMQRLHEEDLTGHLMSEENGRPDDHEHICFPAELDEDILDPPEVKDLYINGLFWPSRFSRPQLRVYKRGLGELQAAGQLQQRPTPKEGTIVKRKWFEIVDPAELSRDRYAEPVHFFLDSAYSEKQENDPSGLMAAFKGKESGDLYIMNIAEVFKGFPELIRFIQQYVQMNDWTESSILYVEPKASGKSIVQQLKTVPGFNVKEIESELIRDDKLQRLSSVAPIIEAGKVKLVRGTWNEKYITQLTTFPRAKHDEFVDLTAYAVDQMIRTSELTWGFI